MDKIKQRRNLTMSIEPCGVVESVNNWFKTNPNCDPRMYLDNNWESVRVRPRQKSDIDEIREWCKNTLPNDCYNYFDKFWFTSTDDLALFMLTWG